MPRYIKIYKDNRKRNRINICDNRKKQVQEYLGRRKNKQKAIRLNNYCQVSGSARSYYNQFALSRHMFKRNMASGSLPGVMKSSW